MALKKALENARSPLPSSRGVVGHHTLVTQSGLITAQYTHLAGAVLHATLA
eukprot:SAG25_NODE_14387_length_255_cov_1.000000_1_plen_50_part_10